MWKNQSFLLPLSVYGHHNIFRSNRQQVPSEDMPESPHRHNNLTTVNMRQCTELIYLLTTWATVNIILSILWSVQLHRPTQQTSNSTQTCPHVYEMCVLHSCWRVSSILNFPAYHFYILLWHIPWNPQPIKIMKWMVIFRASIEPDSKHSNNCEWVQNIIIIKWDIIH